jgi:hypothetical protein
MPSIDEFRDWLVEQLDALPESGFTLSDFQQAADTAAKAGEIAVSLGLPNLTKQLPVQHGYLGIGVTGALLRDYLETMRLQ